MKACPICSTKSFGDAAVCHRCLNRFAEAKDNGDASGERDTLEGLKLRGLTLEGNPTGLIERPCTFEGFKDILVRAKDAWDGGQVSKYLIVVLDGDTVIHAYRPDKYNFEYVGKGSGVFTKSHVWRRSVLEATVEDDTDVLSWIAATGRLFHHLMEEQGIGQVEGV